LPALSERAEWPAVGGPSGRLFARMSRRARGHVSPQPREWLGGRRTARTGAGDRVTLVAWYRSRDLNPDEVALNGV